MTKNIFDEKELNKNQVCAKNTRTGLDGKIYQAAFYNLDVEQVVAKKQQLDYLSLLFNRDRSVISKHIKNIFCEGELEEKSSCAKNARQVNGQVHHI